METNSTAVRIIEGAADLFFSHGYSKVTVDEIAEHVGITKKTIYNHFPAKLDLLDRVIQRSVQTIIDNLERIVNNPDLDLRERLMKSLAFIFTELSDTKRNLLLDFSRFTTEIDGKIIPQIREKLVRIVQQLYDEGVSQGLVKADVSREILPYTFMCLVWGEVVLYRRADLGFNPGELLIHSIRYALDGVLTERGIQVLLREGYGDGHEQHE
jgi:AcrR family transcriptional regulator